MTQALSRPLSSPVKEGDTAMILQLVAEGVPLEGAVHTLPRHQCTPLTLAVEVKRIESIRALLDAGADINNPDPMGRTPLEAAFISGSNRTRPATIEIVRELVARGAVVTPRALERARDTYDAMGNRAYPSDLITLLDNSR
ncbi:ankyrin repeat domain-containing protein [Plantibacter sp. VKM Ac-2880]|uniref:ankyrin repeat domain-containing protein n=1 Tax=Plantibacter sp. VKM Ac-2880 TaxID=2783827 RepID=UPI0018903335|nr:ankyrin repeat domain-containing protein [Plantibacter sp. VKM Ac-2880]MBF4567362.1 ankyrin repeat domain-containing protein [Plantibacter sp. VKM Ac-2880]